MTLEVQRYFLNAQLSMAAYVNLDESMNNNQQAYINALKDAGFSQPLAAQFASSYSIAADTFSDRQTGLSATLFQRNGSAELILAIRGTETSSLLDLALDGQILLGEADSLSPQYRSLKDYYQQLIADGELDQDASITVTGHSSGGFLAQAFTIDFPTNVAHAYTYNAPGFGGLAADILDRLGIADTTIPSGLITNVISQNGFSATSGFGTLVGSVQNIFIESTLIPKHNHSIATAVDALGLYDLFARIDDAVTLPAVTDILRAAADSANRPNSLEFTLDAVRRLFASSADPMSGPTENRETYWANLLKLQQSPTLNGSYDVNDLVGISAGDLKNLAEDSPAYRYALVQLNPFVVGGVDYQALHSANGELDLFNAATQVGALSDNYLTDRAEFLAQKIALSLSDDTGVSAPDNRTAFRDLASGYQIVPYKLQAAKVFGSSEADTVNGTDSADRLYGGGGDDIIMGGKGIDYIEGGAGSDIIQGGKDNDTVEGGSGNDFITGGHGDDLLKGGAGYDQYFYNAGDGNDTIDDADGQGVLVLDHSLLQGGIRQAGANEWVNLDGTVRYELTGADLKIMVNGSELTIIGHQADGRFGITLDDAASYSNELPTRTEFTNEVPDPDNPGQMITVSVFDDGSNGYTITEAENDIVHALGGDDIVFATGGGNDQLYGEEGNDILGAGLGNDQLYGGIGSDQLQGDDGDDTLSGEDDNDTLLGGSGEDVLLGGAGDDVLKADGPDNPTLSWDPANDGSDWLDGGSGNDNLTGGGNDDVLSGGTGDDSLFGDYSNVFLGMGGDDTLDGGDGNDGLVGGAGADILFGGEGNDLLYGDLNADDQGVFPTVGGDDVLYGDDGNDVLYGGIGSDALFGGAGNDHLDGGEGNDELHGGEGNDALSGGAGDDVLDGGAGDDLLDGGDGNNILSGGGGNDEFVGQEGNDTFAGGDGNDKLTGAEGNDDLSGGAGNDMLLGDDRVTVNSIGVSEFTAAMSAGTDTLIAGEGDDKVYGSGGDDVLLGGAGNDLLVGDDFIFNAPQVGFDGNFVESFRYSNLSGNDHLDGGAGDDEVYGGAGDDAITGGSGDDVLYGDRRALFGGDYDDIQLGGNDIMDGGEGDDYLDAGVGDDILSGGDGKDNLFGGDGNDSLDGGAGDDLLQGDGGGFGFGIGDDRLIGGEGHDQLFGGDGNDALDGGAGNDLLDGGYSGSDTYVFGDGYGRDEVRDSGFDFGEVDVVQMNSNVTPDDLDVMRNGDHLAFKIRGANDQLTVQNFFLDPSYQIEQVQFADGTFWDTEAIKDRLLTGSDEKRRLEGFSDRDDLIRGSSADEVLIGAGGQDILAGGAGEDSLYGGSGSDTYLFGRGSGRDTVLDAPGSGGGSGGPPPSFAFGAEGAALFASSSTDLDTIRMDDDIAPGDVTVFRDGHHLLLRLNEAIPAEGSPATDQLRLSYFFADPALQAKQVEFGDGTLWDAAALQNLARPLGPTEQSDALHGTAGDDSLMGLGGDDLLDGHAGADRLLGGSGDDTYVVDQAGDVVQEAAGEGLDTVESSISHALGDHVENLILTGTASIDGAGNELDNVLTGNAGANVLTGGFGNDTYVVGAEDTVVEAVGEGTDTVVTVGSHTLEANVENLTLAGGAAIDGLGNELDNVLTGNNGANVLDGGAGADTLIGGKGNDTYLVDADDSVVETAGGGLDTVLSAQTHVLGANIENLILTGSAAVDGTGNELDNVLTGNEAANVLAGGAGHDVYVVGLDDTVLERAGEGIDTVVSGDSYTLGENLENLTLAGSQAIDGTGNESDNVLIGNSGNNALTGGAGNDTYLFGRGGGQDLVLDDDATAGNLDRIQMADDVAPGDVAATRVGDDLILSLRGTGDHLTVQNFFLDSAHQVEAVVFGDGTVWDQAAIADRLPGTLTGTSDEDTLYGGGGADFLDGAAGNDALYGYDGDDTYLFGAGFGQDTVLDYDPFSGNTDSIQMSADVTPDDVAVIRSGDDLVLAVIGATDQLTVQSFFTDQAYQVEQVSFADGTTWDAETLVDKTRVLQQGGLGNDFLRGVSPGGHGADDLLDGGAGDDTLLGDNVSGVGFGGADKLLGGEGNDVLFGRGGDDVLEGGVGHDLLQGDGGFTDGFSGLPVGDGDVTGNDRLLGQDGNDSLYGAGGDDYLDGGAGDDVLSGDGGFGFTSFMGTASPGNDRLFGGEGNDELNGGAGDDLLDGGSGNDILIGGAGNDVFVFGRGYGQDCIEGFGSDGDFSPTSVNTIRFATDVAVSDVSVTRSGDWSQNDLTFQINGTDDQLTVREFVGGGYTPIQQVQFIDGTLWDLDTLRTLSSSIVGTSDSDSLTGVELDETLAGLDGDDTLDGGIGSDSLIGGGGDDTYIVDNEWDRIVEVADEGLDSVLSSVNYTLAEHHVENLTLQDAFDEFGSVDRERSAVFGIGNDGDNVISGNSVGNVLDGGAGDDLLSGGSEGAGGGGGAGFAAEAGFSEGEGESISSGTGDDILIGGEGNDTYLFNFGDGTDTIADIALPGQGNRIRFGEGLVQEDLTFEHDRDANTLTIQVGFEGDALRLMNFDPDHANGSLVVETLEFADGTQLSLADQFPPARPVATDGDDVLTGTPGDDVIDAMAGNDLVDGLAGNDQLLGGPGNDSLIGGTGADILSGGTGDDAFIVDDPGDTVIEAVGEGTDVVESSVSQILSTNVENLTLTGSDAINGTGNELDNVIAGNSAVNVLTGGAGADVLLGGDGADVLDGGSEADLMLGGLGDDTYAVDESGDVVTEVVDEGTDTVQSTVSYTLGANVENLTLTGTAPTGIGNDIDNVITGNDTDNVLDGGDGADTLAGGAGNDSYVVDHAGDAVEEMEGQGTDTVQSSVSYALPANVENLTFVGNADLNGVGNELGNVLTGNSASNVLAGGAGVDWLKGWGGEDLLIGGLGDDTLTGGAGDDIYLFNVGDGIDTVEDIAASGEGNRIRFGAGITQGDLTVDHDETAHTLTITVGTGGDLLRFANFDPNNQSGSMVVETLEFDGGSEVSLASLLPSSETIVGTDEGDVLKGDSGDDVIEALGGNDQVHAGDGNDTVYGGDGDDSLNGQAGNDVLWGDAGDDLLRGGGGVDVLYGGEGTDHLIGGTEDDTLSGDTDDDFLEGRAGDDVLTGGDGNDVLEGEAGNDVLWGDAGDDVIRGGGGLDALYGGAGADHLIGGAEADTLSGDSEDDFLEGRAGDDVLTGGEGNDVLDGGGGQDVLDGGFGDDTLYGGSGNDVLRGGAGVNILHGERGADHLTAGDEGDTLWGEDGDDVLVGGVGSDFLNGGAGADQLRGGLGNDTLVGAAGNDAYSFGRGDGADSLTDMGGKQDLLAFDADINPLDVILEKHANDLRLSLYGSSDSVTVQNWYGGKSNQVETIQAGNGQTLANTRVDQLIQAMAIYSNNTGLTWAQALDQRPTDVAEILAANWQSS